MKPTIVIPMAGNGRRFSDAGYSVIKPLIPIRHIPMIQRVCNSFKNVDANWVFVVQKEHNEKYGLDDVLSQIRPNCSVVEIDGVSEGAACTVLAAEPFVPRDQMMVIMNSDNIIEFENNTLSGIANGFTHFNCIPCFPASGNKWSYVKTVPFSNLITDVREKQQISDYATAGAYIWGKSQHFFDSAREMIKADDRVNGEFYVAPVFNYAIASGLEVRAQMVKAMHGVGTPEDLNTYLDFLQKN